MKRRRGGGGGGGGGDDETGCGVADCLREFTKEEIIKDEYVCPKCKKLRTVRKTMKVVRCPAVLVLHIKR